MKFLKSLPSTRRAYNDFEWPAEAGAIVEAPDWDHYPACVGGLHGLIDGRGNADLLCDDTDAVWYAFESVDEAGNVSDEEAVSIGIGQTGKCHRAIVRVVGTREQAVQWLVQHGCTGVHYGTATAGDYGTATAGNDGTATAGDYGTATAGNGGTATAGDYGTATAGYRGTATAGDYGTATAGNGGTATAGDYGTATAGYRGTATAGYGGTATAGNGGTATAGNGGTATAGDYGTATAGDYGTAIAGYGGTATAGNGGILIICRWNGKRWKLHVAEVDGESIQPDVAYRLDDEGKFIKVTRP